MVSSKPASVSLMSVRISVGDIFWAGADAMSKNASNGSLISSLSRLRLLRIGTIMAIAIIS